MPVIDGSIQLAYDTLARFTTWNGILASGQLTVVSDAIGDAVRLKIGDGVTTWTSLPYYNPASSSQTLQQTLGFGNTTSGYNLIVTTNDEIYFGGLTKFSQGYDGTTLILQDVASGDGVYITEGGGTALRGGGSAINIGNDIDVTATGEIFFTGTFYNFDGLSGNKVTYINNSNHLITTNVVTDNNNLFFPSNYGIDNPTSGDVLNIGGSYASTINIGRVGATVNILGTALYEYAANQYVLDKLITLNYGGAVASGIGVGFEIEENNVITGYLKTNASRNGYELLTPAIAYKATLSLASLTADRVHTLPNVAGTLATVDGGQTFTSAVWNATLISPVYGGTGVANNIANTLTFSGSYATTLTLLGTTAITLPTTGTVASTLILLYTDSSAVTGTTANTYLTGSLISAGTLKVGDMFDISTRVIKTGTAGNSIVRYYVNDTNDLSGSPILLATITNLATSTYLGYERNFVIKSATNTTGIGNTSNFSGDTNGGYTGAPTASNIDWTTNKYIVIAVQNGSSADSSLCSVLRVTRW